MDIVKLIKKNLHALVCMALGFFHLIFLAMPFASAFVRYDGDSAYEAILGYDMMDNFWDLGFFGGFSAFLQVISVLLALGLMGFGALMLFLSLVKKEVPALFKRIAQYALFGYAGMYSLMLLCLIIVTVQNTEKVYGMTVGISLSAGIFITLIFGWGAALATKILGKRWEGLVFDEPVGPLYRCKHCARTTRTPGFCLNCGGPLELEGGDAELASTPLATPATAYKCEACTATFTGKVAECPYCASTNIVPVTGKDAPSNTATSSDTPIDFDKLND